MKIKLTVLLIMSFSLGFALHWLIAKQEGLSFITSTQAQLASFLKQNVAGQEDQDQFITSIDYDGKKFKPSSVTVKKGNYIAITNTSRDQLMWLISDNQDLQTARGYGEGEKLQFILLKEGTYKVTNRLDTKGFLGVVVEP